MISVGLPFHSGCSLGSSLRFSSVSFLAILTKTTRCLALFVRLTPRFLFQPPFPSPRLVRKFLFSSQRRPCLCPLPPPFFCPSCSSHICGGCSGRSVRRNHPTTPGFFFCRPPFFFPFFFQLPPLFSSFALLQIFPSFEARTLFPVLVAVSVFSFPHKPSFMLFSRAPEHVVCGFVRPRFFFLSPFS